MSNQVTCLIPLFIILLHLCAIPYSARADSPLPPPSNPPAPVVTAPPDGTATPPQQQAQQFTYPATVEATMTMWATIFEICGRSGAQPWDVHIGETNDSTVTVLKVQGKFFTPFVREASKAIKKPEIRLNRIGDNTYADAVFEYEMAWPTDRTTVLDDQLKTFGQNGIQVQKHVQTIAVVCAGDPPMAELLGLFETGKAETKEKTK
jgi:hypothetical protein